MIYEQLLPSKGTKLDRVKRAFQIMGLIHFLTGLLAIIFALIIYWKWALLPLLWFCIGFIWGSLSYLFSKEYKYVFKNGILTVYKLNSYNKFKVKLECNILDIKLVTECKYLPLTNLDEKICIEYNKVVYAISPDNYLKSLILQGQVKE